MAGPHLATVRNVGCTADRFQASCSCSWAAPHQRVTFGQADADAQAHIGQQTLPLEAAAQLELFT